MPPQLAASQSSSTFTMSDISQSFDVTPDCTTTHYRLDLTDAADSTHASIIEV
jgi:hypothetical protein